MFPSLLPHTTRSTIKTSPKLVNFCVCLYCFNCLNCLYCLHCLYCLYCLNCLYCLCCLNCLYYLYCLYCLYCLNCLNCLIHSYCTRCGKVCNGKFEVKKHIINNMWLQTDRHQTDRQTFRLPGSDRTTYGRTKNTGYRMSYFSVFFGRALTLVRPVPVIWNVCVCVCGCVVTCYL